MVPKSQAQLAEWWAVIWINRLQPLHGRRKKAFAERFRIYVVRFFKRPEHLALLNTDVRILDLLERLTLKDLAREVLLGEADLLPTASDEVWKKLVAEAEEFAGMPVTHSAGQEKQIEPEGPQRES